MKKQILVLVAIAAVMLAIGCVSSGTDNAASEKPSTSSAAEPTPSASSAQPTPSANSNQAADQDTEWFLYVAKYSPILTADFNDYSKATESSDYTLLETSGQKIIDDTQKALDENSKYKVSSQYQDAQKEWTAGLQDYNSAGKYIVSAANDGKAGNDNTENLQQAASLVVSGASHINKASDMI
jgi:hypothetical protein